LKAILAISVAQPIANLVEVGRLLVNQLNQIRFPLREQVGSLAAPSRQDYLSGGGEDGASRSIHDGFELCRWIARQGSAGMRELDSVLSSFKHRAAGPTKTVLHQRLRNLSPLPGTDKIVVIVFVMPLDEDEDRRQPRTRNRRDPLSL